MSWNYRIIRYHDGTFGLHEVYYDKANQPWGMTKHPCRFLTDRDPDDLIKSLEMAAKDARERPILDQPKRWPGKAP